MAMFDKPQKDEEAIFNEAIRIKSDTERTAFIKSACGDDAALLARVEALLKVHFEDKSFLKSPPAGINSTLDAPPLTESPGMRIGRYKLLQLIGEGGFGVVYMAEQEEPIRRKVALKIIKLGMDTKQVIARFEAERQALAMMDHPNISRVFDAGATETGRPYFVMELVKGIPITEYCDKNNLDTQNRLELFIDVCKAIQHAHQKGIIHRDIKPSNVMITLHDGKPVPKIIDFGIAKATQHRLTEKTLFTEYRQFVGTPEYMSPEQAEMSGLDVDTRSDIYSLGVLLYELLTSTTPFKADKLRSAAYDEIRRIIREQEPPRPSTRLSTLGEALTDVAKHRSAQPKELRKIVRGDLDWVVMRAIEKDRTRRYETASELAADIERHLGDEPVSAGPPGVRYRLHKFVRRHKTGVAAGLLFAAVIVMGLVVSTTMFFQAEQARKKENAARLMAEQARQKETEARTQAEQAESAAKQQRQRAQRLLAMAQLDRGAKLLNEDNCLGLLDLLDARITADEIPDLRDSAARLWAIAYDQWEGRLVQAVQGAGDQDLAFSPDGRLLATAHGTTLQLWDTTTWQTYDQPLQLGKSISAVEFSPDGKLLAAHSVEGVSRLWDTATLKAVGPVLRHNGGKGKSSKQSWELNRAWCSAAFNPDGKLLVTASLDGTVRLWETSTGQPYGQPLQHGGEVWAVAFSPDGNLLASCSDDGTLRLWEVAGGQPHSPALENNWALRKVVFSPDGKLTVTIHRGNASIWETDTGRLYKRLVHGGGLEDVAFSPDGNLLATASQDRTVQLWDTKTGEPYGERLRHEAAVWAVAFSPDGKLLATSSRYKTVRLWDVASGRPYGQPFRYQGQVFKPVFSPDGRCLASSSYDGTTRIWGTFQRRRTEVLSRQKGIQLGVISPDGKVGAILAGNTVHLWETNIVQPYGEPLQHEDNVLAAAFSPDGKLLAGGLNNGTARLWDVAGRQPFGPLLKTGRPEGVVAVAFSPDGKLLADGSVSWQACVFEVATGRLLRTFQCEEQLHAVAFRPDGKVLATASENGTVQQWDITTGQQLGPPLQHEGQAWVVAYSPDGNILATASGDKAQTIRLWDMSTGPSYIGLELPASPVPGSAALESFNTDGTISVKELPEGKARVWRLPAAPTDLREMELRTWVALCAQRNPQGEITTIQWQRWRELREELRLYELLGSQADKPQLADEAEFGGGAKTKLKWRPGFDAAGHNVYFGASPEGLKFLCQVKDANFADLLPLDRDNTYWWRVDTVKTDGTVIKGILWKGSCTGKLVGWWKFDETSGSIAKDSSGNGFNAKVEPGRASAIWEPNSGFDSKGSAKFTARQYVLIPNAVWGQIGEKLSIAFWVNQDPNHRIGSNWPGLMGCAKTPGLSWPQTNWLQFRAYVPTPEGAIDIGNDKEMVWWSAGDANNYAGRWNHYVFIKNVNTRTLTLYHNGVKVDERLNRKEPMPDVNNFIVGGKTYPDADWYGRIDDLRIYSYALSQAEVAALYHGEESGPLAGQQWTITEVGREEYAAPAPEPEKGDGFCVPLASEFKHHEDEQSLIEMQEEVEIKRNVFGKEHPDTLSSTIRQAWLYKEQGRNDEANRIFDKLLEVDYRALSKGDPNILNSVAYSLNILAWVLATSPRDELRDGAKAIDFATMACKLSEWKEANWVDTLAAAYAEVGDFDSAVKWQKKAIGLFTGKEPAGWRVGFEARLKLYQSGKPYREDQ